jgi:protein TonB
LLAGISGTVFLEGLIDEEGNVVNLKVVSGNEVLAAAAVNAVKQWKYSPMILTGEPISVTTVIKVIFNIRH